MFDKMTRIAVAAIAITISAFSIQTIVTVPGATSAPVVATASATSTIA